MEITEPNFSTVSLIDAHHESKTEPPREHLGASLLGHQCERFIWLSFRWAFEQKFPGRIKRLFRRGHLEEATVIEDLKAIGARFSIPTEGGQFGVDFGCHIKGSIDGVIFSGVPEAPKARHILEIKTHSKKSFDDVSKNGVQKSKPQHWAQMQVYMLGMGIDRALYFAVCKDDDRIYCQRINLDKDAAELLVARAKRIALSDEAPIKLSERPDWWECKFCPAYDMCHQGKPTDQVNCRTCAHSTALENGNWRCERHAADGIPAKFQQTGCDSHVLHPNLVPWPLDQSQCSETQAAYVIDGVTVRNGEGDAFVFSSKEIIANAKGCAELVRDPALHDVRTQFGGKVVA